MGGVKNRDISHFGFHSHLLRLISHTLTSIELAWLLDDTLLAFLGRSRLLGTESAIVALSAHGILLAFHPDLISVPVQMGHQATCCIIDISLGVEASGHLEELWLRVMPSLLPIRLNAMTAYLNVSRRVRRTVIGVVNIGTCGSIGALAPLVVLLLDRPSCLINKHTDAPFPDSLLVRERHFTHARSATHLALIEVMVLCLHHGLLEGRITILEHLLLDHVLVQHLVVKLEWFLVNQLIVQAFSISWLDDVAL